VSVVDHDSLFALLRETASEVVPDSTSERLLETAREPEGRSMLIGLVNRTGLTNSARLAVISAVSEVFEPVDALPLARAVARQHPSVVLAAMPLLESSASTAALFAVRKPLRRGDAEIDAACDRAAARLATDTVAERYIRRTGVPPAGFSAVELGFAAAAAAPETLAAIREKGADQQLNVPLAAGIQQLLGELAAASRNGSLSEFEGRLRDELHEAVVLTGLPADSEQQEKSLTNVFRRRDLADVSDLARHLPQRALSRYATRALNRANRRSDRADRAVLALKMLAETDAAPRRELRAVMLECLDEQDASLVAAAIATLTLDADELPPADRRRVIQRFGGLPPELQQSLAPQLSGLATTAEEELDFESFLRWVDGADDQERTTRLHALKTRWDTTVIDTAQATELLSTLARGIHRLPTSEQDAWRGELLEGALSWLFRQGTQIVEPSRALLTWPGFAALVLEDLDLSLSLLRADQARGLLLEILRQTNDAAPVVSEMAHSEIEPDVFRRVLIPVLGEALRRDLRAADTAFRSAQPVAQRTLLDSALTAATSTKRRIEALGQTTQDEADAAVARHGAAVLAALRDAEHASEGNVAIENQFDAIRRAVESVLATSEVAGVPADVSRWRSEAAARYPDDVIAADNGQVPLQLAETAPAPVVMRVLDELDQRVHSTRVVTAAERTHLRRDLLDCVDHIVRSRMLEGSAAEKFSSRPALGQLIWARWAEQSEDPTAAMLTVLGAEPDRQTRQLTLLKADALASHLSDEMSSDIAGELSTEALRNAWSLVTAGLANRLRQADSLEQEAKTRGVEVMERVAERLDAPLRAIEGFVVGYYRLRRRLSDAGWKPIEDTLGKELRYEQLDPNLHEIDGTADAELFVVRSTGVRVRGRPIRRAVVEPLEPGGPDDRD
jgi:hypothetical protein